MSREQEERSLGTADLVAAADSQSAQQRDRNSHADMQQGMARDADTRDPADMRDPRDVRVAGQGRDTRAHDEPLAALFPPEMAGDFQSRWDAVQIGFVDDPKAAVQQADELVAQVMRSLAESFANERARFDAQLDDQDSGSTENMRVALRRYRSFFQRLLSL